MRSPTIDELLAKVGSIYELTMLAAKEARRIRIKNKDVKEPLQIALERIAQGKVKGQYLTAQELEDYKRKENERHEAAAAAREKSQERSPD